MIEFKNIQKSFGDKVVLDDVSHIMERAKQSDHWHKRKW